MKTAVRLLFIALSPLQLGGCYWWHVSVNQMRLLSQSVPIEEALEKHDFTEEEKKKLLMVEEIKSFARERLKMDIDEDVYTSYVQLDSPYVTYVLRVSHAYELKPHTWWFPPPVGSVPYKGFFDRELALEEEKSFPPEKYDTWVRGVTAYSTLDWFDDPVLSSMLAYPERHFVVTVFHELTHTVLFFSGKIDFNERFAEFVGRKAAEIFYREREGENSETVQLMRAEWADELAFSSYMEKEYKLLDQWYKDHKGENDPAAKKKRIREIQERFQKNILPNMNTSRYDYFPDMELNNAILLSYRTYTNKMGEFEQLFALLNEDMEAFIGYCARFEDAENPGEAFSSAVSWLAKRKQKEAERAEKARPERQPEKKEKEHECSWGARLLYGGSCPPP